MSWTLETFCSDDKGGEAPGEWELRGPQRRLAQACRQNSSWM